MTKSDLKIKLAEWEKELKLNELAKKTIVSYIGDVQKFLDFIPSDNDEITKDLLINYKSSLDTVEIKRKKGNREIIQTGKKEASKNRNLISINKFLSFCDMEDFKLKGIKQQGKTALNNLLTVKEFQGIVRQAEEQKEWDIYWAVKTLTLTGVRYSELKFVTVEACKSKKLKITNKGKVREFEFNEKLAKDLLAWAKSKGITSGMIFITKNGTFIKNEQFSRKLKKVAGKAHFVNMKKIHPHAFRHLFALTYLETTNNIADVANRLGHSSLNTTRIYLQTTPQQQRQYNKEMENKLGI